MTPSLQRSIAASLVLYCVLLTGPVYAQTVQHATHHAHHKAATHSTVLCSLMCSAGQVLQATSIGLQAELGLASVLPVIALTEPATITLLSSSSRAPPHFAR